MRKILFLCNYFPPEHEAGDSIFARDFIFGLNPEIYSISIATRIPINNSYLETKRSGINIIYQTDNWRIELSRYIEKSNPDLVCVFQVLNVEDILLIKKKYNISIIYFQQINFRNHLKYNGANNIIAKYEKMEVTMLKNSDLIFCMSDDDLYETKKINANVFQIEPGINPIIRLKVNKENKVINKSNSLKIGVTGRLNDRTKGIDLLIKALEKMDRKVLRKTKISFLGASDCDSLIVSLKKIMSLTRIDIKPWTRDEVSYNNWLVSNDLLVVPSRYENVCLTAIEAIFCGIPVVGASTGHMKKYLINNITGWLLPTPVNESVFVSALSKRLTTLINSPDKVFSTSQFCREYAKKRFNINSTIETFLQGINKI